MIYSLDTETNAKDARSDPEFKVLGLSLAWKGPSGELDSKYFPIGHVSGNMVRISVLSYLRDLLSDPDNTFVFHNAKFDIPVLRTLDLPIPAKWYDTMLMQHMINENVVSKSLESLGMLYFKVGKVKDELMDSFIKGPGWAFIPVYLIEPYAKVDAELTLRLFYRIYPEFIDQGFDGGLWDVEKEFLFAIEAMEQVGLRVDEELSRQEIAMGQARMAEILQSLDGLKPTSPKDLEELLVRRLGLPLVKPTKATKDLPKTQWKPSFDKFAMEEYEAILSQRDDHTAKLILEYRGWQKSISTYFTAFLEKRSHDGRVRPNFKIHGTKTTRLSCTDPNFQQVPKTRDESKRWNMHTKRAIIPSVGFGLWEFDYSNLELRLSASYSGQQDLIDAFNRGEPIWDYMSNLLGGWSKEDTKTLTYSIMYGAGLNRLMNVFGVDQKTAGDMRNKYFATFPKFKWASDRAKEVAMNQKFIKLWTGRRRHFEFADESRKAFNSYLQGGGAEIVKRSLIRIWREVCDENCVMVLTVHDSILFEIREGMEQVYQPRILQIMEDVPSEFGVVFPADVHVWGE